MVSNTHTTNCDSYDYILLPTISSCSENNCKFWNVHRNQKETRYYVPSRHINLFIKVHIFWEGHQKFEKISQLYLILLSNIQYIYFFIFCGLLRIYDYYIHEIAEKWYWISQNLSPLTLIFMSHEPALLFFPYVY